MAKLLKITGKIIGSIYEWLLILLIVIAFAIRTSPVQTWLAEKATDFLSKELDTELHIDRVDIYFFDRVALDGVFIRDQHGDTLASLGSVEVVLQSLDLGGNAVTLRRIGLEDGRVGISRDSLTGDYNYFFITDYFDGGPKKKPKKEPVDLTIRALNIDHVDITYDDNRKSWSEYGMDYDHLSFQDVVLRAAEMHVNGNNVKFTLYHLSAKERCGIHLKRLRADCDIGDRGILLSNVIINTSRSRIFASKFDLKMNGLQQVHEFVDSVTFDAVIDSSRINLTDVSYFAPQLKGMTQKVQLTAKLTQKVKDLKISGIDLRTGQRTVIRGNLLLPDFRSLDGSFLKENLEYAYVDLNDIKALRLPDNVEEKFIHFDPMIARLGYFEVKRMDIIGYWSQFVLSSRQISTQLGTLHLDNGLLFTELKEGGYAFERSANSDYDVYIDSFQLGKFIDDPMFGKVNGSIFMSGVVGQKDIIRLNKLDGIINSLGFNGYNYSNIAVREGSFIDNIFKAHVDVTDPHLEMAFDGTIDLNGGRKYLMDVEITNADLGKLNIAKDPDTKLMAGVHIDMQGTDLSNYRGTVTLLHEFRYEEDSNVIAIPELTLTLTRGAVDHVDIRSAVADIDLDGKINPNLIAVSLNNALAVPLSAYFQPKPLPRKTTDNTFFDLTVTAKKTNEVLAVFAPQLYIASGTVLTMNYDARQDSMAVRLNSPKVMYDSIVVTSLAVRQSLSNGEMKAEIDAGMFRLNDSLYVQKVDIDITGKDNVFNTIAKWNDSLPNPAKFDFQTTLATDRVAVLLRPSHFSVKNQQWEIMNSSELVYTDKRMEIDHFVLEREEQFIAVNGVLSDLPEDQVTVNINDLQLKEFSSFINAKADIEGKLKGDVRISTPFTNFRADGELTASGLIVSDEPIGDVYSKGTWDSELKRVKMEGNLKYLKRETFDYEGFYYPYSETNNLDFKLDFKKMDMQFANAFIDPEVVRDIRGDLEGTVTVKGKTEEPVIDGKLNLSDGNVLIGLLGVNLGLSGPIRFNGAASAIYIDNMPVIDEENNTAFLTAAINHTGFAKWNCDIDLNIEDDYSRRDFRGRALPIDKFLVLNTRYKEGTIYYGRAYVTGTANIFVTEELTKITVRAKTEEDTWINIPLYGNSEIEEGDFISFDQTGLEEEIEQKLDLSNVDLDLGFDITPEARVKLIFNDKTSDEITAYGEGHIDISVSSLNDVAITGSYKIDGRSMYNFVMGPIKQEFNMMAGGTIIWTGDPYNAALNLTAYNRVKANINEITPDIVTSNTNSSGNQEVRCVMYITQTLDDPLITLDIQAPNASDYGQAVLNSIRSNKEELQKQFFSLLIFKKFAPLAGQTSAGTGGLADVLSKQLTTILNTLSEDVKFNVDYDGDEVTGDKTVKVGSQFALGQNDRIIVKGSFGVANTSTQSSNQTNLIGDMSLEYLINSDGTFRVNLFNESNENSVIQDKTQGLFTQGVGLHYQEDFNSVQDFKLIQSVLDRFRKKKRVKITKHRREVPIYPDGDSKDPGQPEQPAMNNGIVIPPKEEKTNPGETPVTPE